jgi:hypothetical protein
MPQVGQGTARHRALALAPEAPNGRCLRRARLIQINGPGMRAVQGAGMQSIADRLADVNRRIVDGESRLAELQGSAADDAVTALLIEIVIATLKLLREHRVRLERHLASRAPSPSGA